MQLFLRLAASHWMNKQKGNEIVWLRTMYACLETMHVYIEFSENMHHTQIQKHARIWQDIIAYKLRKLRSRGDSKDSEKDSLNMFI